MEAEDIAMTQEAASQLAERLLQLLKEEKLYLRPDLKISDITLKLQTNRNYLYYAINDRLHTSFAELVNSMRIEQAQEILKNHPQCNLYDLMTQSGYFLERAFSHRLSPTFIWMADSMATMIKIRKDMAAA